MENFKKYKVLQGDTVESISKKIGIPAIEVRTHHNRYCDVCDLIEFGLPIRNAKYVLLPSLESYIDSKTAKKNALKKVFSKPENNLRLSPRQNLILDYGTIIHYRENSQLRNKIHFTSQIEFLKKTDDFFIIKLQINQVYINNKAPNLVIEQLADKISKALYPINLSLSEEGKINDVLNIQDIQERWKIIKPSILEYYKSENVIAALISSFENNIKSASLLKRNLEKHPFFQIYFMPIYQSHSPDLIFSNIDLQSEIFQNVDEFQTPTGKICLTRKGIEKGIKENASENIAQNLEKNAFEIGKLDDGIVSNSCFQYKLHHSNSTIFSITGFINSRQNDKTISTIEFETYERGKKKEKKEILNPISRNIDWNAEIINEKEISEGGFWDKFWGR